MNVEGIKLVDATLRDGGLVNDFFFDDDFVRALYIANVQAGVDYMEFGYRADKKQFDDARFGKWKFTCDDDIRGIVGENDSQLKISVMVDVGRTDYKKDICPKSDSPVDMFRVATYMETLSEAITMIEYISALGYETTCNIMAISRNSDEQISAALRLLTESPVVAVYIVDSYGAMYPKQIRKLTRLYHGVLSRIGKGTGIHAHNNQQCAFANTIEANEFGAKWLDATVYGMGRGAGNCNLEALLGYLDGEKYRVGPMLEMVEKWMLPMREVGIEWGYNTSYLLTGLTNQHPRTAIAASREKDYQFVEQYKYLSYQ